MRQREFLVGLDFNLMPVAPSMTIVKSLLLKHWP